MLRAITPVWAQKIRAERCGDELRITGWGCVRTPIETRELKNFSRLNILQRLKNYSLSHLNDDKSKDSTSLYQFADATDDEMLVSFCAEFGPVWGHVRSEVFVEGTNTTTVVTAQSMKKLRREQRRFRAAVDLWSELTKNMRADYMIVIDLLARLGIDRQNLALIHSAILAQHRKPDIDDLLLPAHVVLCGVLDQHAPKLRPIEGGVIELPEVSNEGILDAIYYQLRVDYRAGREIAECPNCRGHFSVLKRGARTCGKQRCQRALRNQSYWSEHKDQINRKRRSERAEKE